MKKTAVCLIVLMLTTIGAAWAKPPCGAAGQRGYQYVPLHRWWQVPQVAEKLEITPAETEQLNHAYRTTREKLIDLAANGEKTMMGLETQLEAEKFDKSACLKQFNQLQKTRTELAATRFQFVLDTREILGRERFNRLREEFTATQRQVDSRKPRSRSERTPRQPPAGNRPCPLY